MEARSTPAGFEDIRRDELTRTFGRMLHAQRFLQPVIILGLVYVVVVDKSRWRAVTVAAVTILAIIFSRIESRRVGRLGATAFRPVVPLFLIVPATVLVTGALRSPWLLAFIPSIALIAISRSRGAALSLVAGMIAIVWVLLPIQRYAAWTMPSAFLDEGGRTNFAYLLFTAILFTIVAVHTAIMGINLGAMSDTMLIRSLEARDEMLRLHAERLSDLTTMSGEIAHELKNPLASIKGLASLIEVDPARAGERVKVLRGEVDRMQGVLEEFLNFSRPLVPLAQSSVDLGEICREVMDLHEGVAGARRLTLVAAADELVEARCDPRKIKQTLINLLQNAVEASTDGGEIHVVLDKRNDIASIRILDRGHGLSADIATRAFDAGVTSKSRGSGLGLAIVRTLAEQHGGSVTLSNREGGGCVAELLLPLCGAPAPATPSGERP